MTRSSSFAEVARALAVRYPDLTPQESQEAAESLLRKLAGDLTRGAWIAVVSLQPGGAVDIEVADITGAGPDSDGPASAVLAALFPGPQPR